MLFLGQYPYQSKLTEIFNETLMVCTYTSLIILQVIQMFEAIIVKDIDATMETVPVIVTELVCVIKLLNHIINKGKFDKLYDIMKKEWDMLSLDEQQILEEITKRGSKLTNIYRSTLFYFSIIFVLFPLIPPILDVVSPLNETRSRIEVIKLQYLFDMEKNFYSLYVYTGWCSFMTMMVIITIDALYVVIIHHTCGLFAVCGYQIKKTTEHNVIGINGNSMEEIKKCLMMHARALNSFDTINEITSTCYLFQVGLNMIGISVTSVLAFINLDRPEEFARIACFLIAQQLHLLVISVPGQIITDQSSKLTIDIYNSMWYQTPVWIQKILHIVQIRSGKPCKLVAGGLYEMNIENFGSTESLSKQLCPVNCTIFETKKEESVVRVLDGVVDVTCVKMDEQALITYFHLSWTTITLGISVLSSELIYVLLIHHTSGLFAVAGCYNVLQKSSVLSYLFQVGLNIVGLSVSAVQTVGNIDDPTVALRNATVWGAKQIHLFIISIPGQVLIDHCVELYSSKWYNNGMEAKKILQVMQQRASKPCILYRVCKINMKLTNKTQNNEIFQIQHYQPLQKFLQFLGQDPSQRDGTRGSIVFVMVLSVLGILIPTFIEIYVQLCEKNMDAVIECLPNGIAAATSVVKLLNVYLNRENFQKMYDLVTREWEQLRMNDELHVLEDITMQGGKLAQFYRNTLLSFMVVFLLVPLVFPFLDVVLPLNETRPRQQGFRVNYLYFDEADYFFSVYFQLAWGAVVVVMIIITVDSLYMIIIHHASGMFAVCGYQVKTATEYKDSIYGNDISENHTHEQFKRCVTTHDKAIDYLIQVGLNMMGISVTAVQAILTLDRPAEALRCAVFLVAEQFHLFIISLPGQTLVDHCTKLSKDIYSSTWYKVPAKFQRVIYTMQIRALKPCVLTAGGLYEMNMENFANVPFQTNKRQNYEIFDIPDYQPLEKLLLFLGQHPYQTETTKSVIVLLMTFTLLSMAIPSLIEMYVQLRKKNMDDMMESFANTIAAATSLVKLLNVYLNRENFRKMYNLVTIEWEQLRMNDEVHVLQEVTLKGSKLAQLYRNALLFAMCVFLLVPLFGPALDIVLPSNETRPRQQLFRVNYIIFDQADYFFYVYIQLFWCTIVLVMAIITVDSLYMIIIYHASGMFAICGFYDILNESSRNSYLLQVGLSMMSISVTAIMLALDRPSEAIRYSVVLGGAQFHLFIISLPGQTLVDHCTMLTNDIYSSTWYKVSAKFQRVIYMMQIRALKPCILTAGGLYEMNMENFANFLKIYVAQREKDFDGVMQVLPNIIAQTGALVKVMNIRINKANFRKLFDLMVRRWKLLEAKDEIEILKKYTSKGMRLRELYKDEYEHFYSVNFHLYTSVISCGMMIIAVDMLYITIIFHLCGLFAVCGYCQILERSSQHMYLIQVGLSVFIISVTAAACIMNIDRPDELIRLAMFVVAQKFHLLILSLPGQMLLDHSLGLADIIYASKWYELPVKGQKLIYTMQMRSIRPCILTAGGVHEMNIESFGIAIKACMSYFMMFLSLKE
ncbi:hypothetical protein WH47_07803 [Habropoda laboriosa]|uniref:Odorant receptor 13a n=1 Tax=Habropoda laboriosa TaxID=597456 RepID=A0A0L7QNY9_9HYME|nr:hypothetical protein WH47_07803 [Habropoda laboriosa]